MIILKDVNQINDRVNRFFKLDNKFTETDNTFIDTILSDDEIIQRVKETGKVLGKNDVLEEISLLLFQLKNYIPALANLSNMLLVSKNFDGLYFFTTKLFISHIGNIHYVSSGNYNFIQRFFDRFIEIVKNCQINKENYIPFILEIFNSQRVGGLTNWKEPALEFMKAFYSENEEWMIDYLQNDKRKFEMMNLLCLFNTQKGLSLSLDYFTNSSRDEEKFLNLFKMHKKEVTLHIDQKLSGADNNVLSKFAKIFLSMTLDTDVKSRLEEIYKRTNDRALRNTISQSIGLTESSSFKNEKQFLFAVRRNVKPNQADSQVFGIEFSDFELKFKSGLPLDDSSYTYLINMFKQDDNLLNLTKYTSLLGVFEKVSFDDFLNKLFAGLFYKRDVNKAKWAIRMLALFSEGELEDKILDYTNMLLSEGKIREGKYLIQALIASKKQSVFWLIKKFTLEKNSNFLPLSKELLQMYADFNDISVFEIEDELVSETFTEKDFEIQKNKLFDAFISGRLYTKNYFERFFINHPLFNKLGQNLVFAEYRYKRAHNAFILDAKNKKFIVSKPLEGEDIMIGILHPQDCDLRFQSAYNHFENPTFNQFEEVLYDVKGFSRSAVSINVFAGMMIKPYDFAKELEKSAFKVNKEDNTVLFNSFVHIMPQLNLVAEIELEKQIQMSTPIMTIANLYFYRLNDVATANGKYVTQKQDAIGVGALPYRYFGYILTRVIKAVKNSK